jgi:hypothetical protein
MIQIYLTTPYKVLSINEIKTKDKEKEEHFSPIKLFRAENALNMDTVFRKRQTVDITGEKNELGLLKKTKTQIVVTSLGEGQDNVLN